MWLVWLIASASIVAFTVGFIAGAIAKMVSNLRQLRREEQDAAEKRQYIRDLADQRRQLLAQQSRLGRRL